MDVLQPETKENTPLTVPSPVSSDSNLDIDTIGDTSAFGREISQIKSLVSFDEQQLHIIVGSYCYLQMDDKKNDGGGHDEDGNTYCRVLQLQSDDTYRVVDLSTMKQRVVDSGYIAIIPFDDHSGIASARKKYKTYSRRLKKVSSSLRQKRVRSTKRTIFVMVFLFVFISGLAVICFWRAQRSLNEANAYRHESTTQCIVSNYTEMACEYDCNQDSRCTGTLFRYEAIANATCGTARLWQIELDEAFCGDRNRMNDSLSLDEAFTCYILDCSQGFYAEFVYPPNELLSIDTTAIVWIVAAFVMLMTGMWCGLYAIGEWIAFLGTDDDKKDKCKHKKELPA